jgi:hypothetical protein
MSLDWVAQQLARSARPSGLGLEIGRYNPRPAGVIRDGGATQAVLIFLQQNPRRYFTHMEIVKGSYRTGKSVDWALHFLRSTGRIEAHHGTDHRNGRYLRYRLVSIVK